MGATAKYRAKAIDDDEDAVLLMLPLCWGGATREEVSLRWFPAGAMRHT